MNPVGEALQRAASKSNSAAELESHFLAEWGRLEFSPDASSVVVGVPAELAVAWAAGRIHCFQLALRTCHQPTAMFWMALPGLSRYRAGLAEARDLFNCGARLIVMHTGNAVVAAHAMRWGCKVTHFGERGQRLLGDEAAIQRWLGRIL